MRRTTTVVMSQVRFIGHLWSGGVAATDVTFPHGHLGEWNRTAVLKWLRHGKKDGSELTPSGDFQDIIDFECDFSEGEGPAAKDWESSWEKEDSESIYLDCMVP